MSANESSVLSSSGFLLSIKSPPPPQNLVDICQSNNVEALVACLSRPSGRAQVNMEDSNNRIPLHHAANSGFHQGVEKLLESGSEVDKVDKFACTPLLLACGQGSQKSVKALLKANASVKARNLTGQTVLHLAASHKSPFVAKLCLDAGAEIDAQDAKGETPLMVAAAAESRHLVSFLLKKGADPMLLSVQGLSAHDLAASPTVASLLPPTSDNLYSNRLSLSSTRGLSPQISSSKLLGPNSPSSNTLNRATPNKPHDLLSSYCVALGAFLGDPTENELSFGKDEMIRIISKDDSGWWTGIVNDRSGAFPSNYVRVATQADLDAALVDNSDTLTVTDSEQNANQSTESMPPVNDKDHPIDPVTRMCRAIAEFNGEKCDGEISFPANAMIEVLEENDDGWWVGRYNDQTGTFPCTFVTAVMTDTTEQQVGFEGQTAASDEPRDSSVLQLVVIANYVAMSDQDLTLTLGDRISFSHAENEDGSGWWYGTLNGTFGRFPAETVQPVEIQASSSSPAVQGVDGNADNLYMAFAEYRAEDPGELSLHVGDIVSVSDKGDESEGWWRGSCNGKSGYFPSTFVHPHEPTDTGTVANSSTNASKSTEQAVAQSNDESRTPVAATEPESPARQDDDESRTPVAATEPESPARQDDDESRTPVVASEPESPARQDDDESRTSVAATEPESPARQDDDESRTPVVATEPEPAPSIYEPWQENGLGGGSEECSQGLSESDHSMADDSRSVEAHFSEKEKSSLNQHEPWPSHHASRDDHKATKNPSRLKRCPQITDSNSSIELYLSEKGERFYTYVQTGDRFLCVPGTQEWMPFPVRLMGKGTLEPLDEASVMKFKENERDHDADDEVSDIDEETAADGETELYHALNGNIYYSYLGGDGLRRYAEPAGKGWFLRPEWDEVGVFGCLPQSERMSTSTIDIEMELTEDGIPTFSLNCADGRLFTSLPPSQLWSTHRERMEMPHLFRPIRESKPAQVTAAPFVKERLIIKHYPCAEPKRLFFKHMRNEDGDEVITAVVVQVPENESNRGGLSALDEARIAHIRANHWAMFHQSRIEEAFSLYSQSIDILSGMKGQEIQLARVLLHFGIAQGTSLTGPFEDNLNKSIETFERAMTLLPESPKEYAQACMYLGVIFRDHPDQARFGRNALELLEKSVDYFRLDIFPLEWAEGQVHLGILKRCQASANPKKLIDASIGHFRNALRVLSRDYHKECWARARANLGWSLIVRLSGSRADNVKEAIQCFTDAIQSKVWEEDSAFFAALQLDLGSSLVVSETNPEKSVDLAIRKLESALKLLHRLELIDMYRACCKALAVAYRVRTKGDHPSNLQFALDYAEDLCDSYDPLLERCDLQSAQVMRCELLSVQLEGGRSSHLQAAVESLNSLLSSTQESRELHMEILKFLGDLCTDTELASDSEYQESAIHWYKSLIAMTGPDADSEWERLAWAHSHCKLASILSRRANGSRDFNLTGASEYLSSSLKVHAKELYPNGWATTTLWQGHVLVEQAGAYFDSGGHRPTDKKPKEIHAIARARRARLRSATESHRSSTSALAPNIGLNRSVGPQGSAPIVPHPLSRRGSAASLHNVRSKPPSSLQLDNASPAARGIKRINDPSEIADATEKYLSIVEMGRKVHPFLIGSALTSLSIISRIKRDVPRQEALEEAIEYAQRAVSHLETSDEPVCLDARGRALVNLGLCYNQRVRGIRASNVSRSLEAFQAGLGILGHNWLRTVIDLHGKDMLYCHLTSQYGEHDMPWETAIATLIDSKKSSVINYEVDYGWLGHPSLHARYHEVHSRSLVGKGQFFMWK